MGDIEFRNVWFAYTERSGGLVSDPTEFSSAEKDSVKNNSEPDRDWVLRGVSFHLTPGTRAAFIGRTGAGKSTIISLITRNYDPQRGQVLVDGIDVREWNLHELRSRVAVVLQDVFLFTGHIRENIAMGGDISDKKLIESLKNADALSFLEKTADAEKCAVLDCAVAEQGLNFSTGERQLLSFARAMASDLRAGARRATAIDTETERRVQRAIDAATRGRTSICIAHRLSTIRNCDVIFGLRDGVIVEQGTHEELLAAGGMYAEMVRGGQRK
ncbi:MAG: ABC transporter ATP-binding protein [Eubacteriales bacterium]